MACWSVNLEGGELWWYAHVVELIGLFTRASSRQGALQQLPNATTSHILWLRNNGTSYLDRSGFDIIEEISDVPRLGESGGAVAIFRTDLESVEEDEFNTLIELMRFNRLELLNLVNPLPKKLRDERPIKEKRTINENLRHISNAEEWYISRLGLMWQRHYSRIIKDSNNFGLRDELIRSSVVREGVLKILHEAHTSGTPLTFQRRAYTNHPEELWSFKKVLRRFVEHEREHIWTIKVLVQSLGQ